MKIAKIIARVALGLIYTVFSLAFFFQLMPQQEMSGPTLEFVMGLAASGYIMPVVKTFELVCGVILLSGRYVPLALVVIFPITLNVTLFHLFLMPAGLPIPILMMAANLFLAYTYRDRYADLFKAK